MALLVAACAGGSGATGTATASAQASAPATATPTGAPSATPEVAVGFDLLVAAMEATIEAGTTRIEQEIKVKNSTLIPDMTSDFGGQASFGADHRMYATGDLTELMGVGEVEMIREGNRFYLGGALAEQITDRAPWVLIDLESDDPAAAPFLALASGQNDLSMTIYYLHGMSGRVAAREDVTRAGLDATLYLGAVDLERARATIPDAYAESLEDLIATMRVGGMSRQIFGEAWVGADGLIHQLRFTFTLGRQQGGGVMWSTIEFSELGEPLDYEVPDGEDVIRIEDIHLPEPGTEAALPDRF